MGFGVEGHGAGAGFSGEFLNDGEFIALGAGDGGRAIAAGGKGVAGGGVEGGGVHAIANGNVGEDFAGGGIDHDHFLVAAAGEEVMPGEINGEAGRLFARGDGPTMDESARFCVNNNDFAFVLEVVVDEAGGGVGDAEFGLAAEGNGGEDFGVLDVDDGGGLAAAVEDVGFLGGRIVEHAVGVFCRCRAW